MKILLGISNHHVHVTKEALEALFGKNYKLNVKRNLKQPGEFAAEETVILQKGDKIIEHVRVIGPCRTYTQVELLQKDCDYLGINAPVRTSSYLDNSETLTMIGPAGKYEAKSEVIVSNKHIHLTNEHLKSLNKENGDIVDVMINGILVKDVHLKANDNYSLEMHINKDEAEKLCLENDMEVTIC
ncbi:MAG: propanediol utilization protein [Tenericutes bacterium]|nr:propanediol utilization protein [Mycoplasmatota bacterium]